VSVSETAVCLINNSRRKNSANQYIYLRKTVVLSILNWYKINLISSYLLQEKKIYNKNCHSFDEGCSSNQYISSFSWNINIAIYI